MSCVFLCLMAGEVFAYVMPLEQILSRVRKRFAGQYSLIIEQATHVILSRDPLREEVFREKVWLKLPRYELTTKLPGSPKPKENERGPQNASVNDTYPESTKNALGQVDRLPNQDDLYRWLLMDNPEGELSAYLITLGIQIVNVGYDRCDGVVAYRVGDRDPESPKLLVDKERFLPLLLSYRLPGDKRRVTVRFKDYRKSDAGWYPYEIAYELEGVPEEVYYILNLTVNAPIETSFFNKRPEAQRESAIRSSDPAPSDDDERLQKIMRNLEKKYR